MAHEVEGARFAYAAGEQTPWHVEAGGIRDNPVPAEMCYDVEACMKAAGMAVTYVKEPVKLFSDGREVEDLYAVRRVEDDKIIPGVGVGKQYQLLQPIEAFRFFQPFFASRQVRFSCAGVLKQGKRFFITARVIGSAAEVAPGDMVRGHLNFATSIDGSLVTHVAFSAVRVVCNNTLSMMVADAKEGLKSAEGSRTTHALRVRHTKGQLVALEAVAAVLDLQTQSFSASVEQYRKLAQVGCLGEDLKRYVKIALDFPTDEALSTRAENIVTRVCDLAVHGKGSGIAGARGTLWGAYNGVTDYLSHEVGRTGDSRVNSLLFDEGARASARALDTALVLAGK